MGISAATREAAPRAAAMIENFIISDDWGRGFGNKIVNARGAVGNWW